MGFHGRDPVCDLSRLGPAENRNGEWEANRFLVDTADRLPLPGPTVRGGCALQQGQRFDGARIKKPPNARKP